MKDQRYYHENKNPYIWKYFIIKYICMKTYIMIMTIMKDGKGVCDVVIVERATSWKDFSQARGKNAHRVVKLGNGSHWQIQRKSKW